MDTQKYSSLLDALTAVPDPRKARGKQLAWSLILTLIAAALANNARNPHAIARWVQDRAVELLAQSQPQPTRLPSEATLRRALHALDLASLEQHLARLAQQLPLASAPASQPPRTALGQAVDGKHLRGAHTHVRTLELIGVVPARP